MIATEIETYQDQHAALDRETAPTWLVDLQNRGLETFTSLGMPTTRLEDWRFTNVASYSKLPFLVAAVTDPGTEVDQASELAEQAGLDESFHRLVFVNGRYCPKLSHAHATPAGETVTNLASVIADSSNPAPQQIAGDLQFDDSAFVALNTAFMHDGAFVDVPDGVELDRPVHLIFVSIGKDRTASYPRNQIRLGNGSKAQVIETYVGEGDTYFTNAVTQARLGEKACLDHYKLQEEQPGTLHIATTDVDQKTNSEFRSHYFSFGASLARNELNCLLDGEHIETTLNGLYMPTGDQLMDCRTQIDHAKPNCNSYEVYKGILDDKAKGVFNGKIFVREDAQKTDAKQSNQGLLLSDDATLNTKPQLEIYADDVKCTHGATIGELEEDAMYYLRARGIPAELARQILIFAFANDVVQGVELPAVRRRLESLLLAGHELTEDIL